MHTPSLLTAGASDSTNLRTVIVTAAVYRGFGSELRLATNPSPYPSGTGQASDPIPPLTSWQSPVFLVNSRLALFTATASGFDTLLRHPFSLSYGVILPSSFARVLPSACGYSPRPPVSVSGTVALATG